MPIQFTSTAFKHNQPIPADYTADGKNASPPLSWSGVPQGTKELALICDDPDAPTPQPWVHWVIYNIPADSTGLPQSMPSTYEVANPSGAHQGGNSFGKIGYGGPAPPRGHGTHHYHFKLYALDTKLNLPTVADKSALLAAMQNHILDQSQIVATYER